MPDWGKGLVTLFQLCGLSYLAGSVVGFQRGQTLWKPVVEQAQTNFSEMKDLFDRQTQVAKEWESIARKMGYSDRPAERNTYMEDN